MNFWETIGVQSVKDGIEILAWIVGIGAVLYAAVTYHIGKKQFNFAVITSCVERFQAILVGLSSDNKKERELSVKQYIDLCNEELFYFKNKYLPAEVVDEWIEGMTFWLPHFDKKDKNCNNNCLPEIVEQNLLQNYPRIRNAFTVDRAYDVQCDKDRRALIQKIKENIARKSK